MKLSRIDRPGAAGVIRGQSPRKSALSSPWPSLAEATAVRVLSIDTITTAITTAVVIGTSSSSLSQSPFSPIALKRFTAAEEGEVYCRRGG